MEAFAVNAKPADCAMLGLRGPLFQAGKQHIQCVLRYTVFLKADIVPGALMQYLDWYLLLYADLQV